MSTPSTEPQVTFEICPECTQRTASHFFRPVGKRRLCNLCAHRVDQGAAALTARTKDANIHEGLGWLWEHVAWTAFGVLGGPLARLMVIIRAIRRRE